MIADTEIDLRPPFGASALYAHADIYMFDLLSAESPDILIGEREAPIDLGYDHVLQCPEIVVGLCILRSASGQFRDGGTQIQDVSFKPREEDRHSLISNVVGGGVLVRAGRSACRGGHGMVTARLCSLGYPGQARPGVLPRAAAPAGETLRSGRDRARRRGWSRRAGAVDGPRAVRGWERLPVRRLSADGELTRRTAERRCGRAAAGSQQGWDDERAEWRI
jgi:hypothetical protein